MIEVPICFLCRDNTLKRSVSVFFNYFFSNFINMMIKYYVVKITKEMLIKIQ